MPVYYERRQFVTPGDLLAENEYFAGENTHKEKGKTYATRVGLFDFKDKRVYVVALKSFYVPIVGDIIIGKIEEVTLSGWVIDIKAPHLAMLRASEALERPFKPQKDDLPSLFDVGDMVIAKILAYDRTRDPQLTILERGLGKITRGQILEITHTKIPRIIGKQGSMINMLKRETGCQIEIGQNGRILVNSKKPEDELLAVIAIRKIAQEAHTTGLTDRVAEMLKREKEKSKGEKEVVKSDAKKDKETD
jgi:exosome complex component RRP4